MRCGCDTPVKCRHLGPGPEPAPCDVHSCKWHGRWRRRGVGWTRCRRRTGRGASCMDGRATRGGRPSRRVSTPCACWSRPVRSCSVSTTAPGSPCRCAIVMFSGPSETPPILSCNWLGLRRIDDILPLINEEKHKIGVHVQLINSTRTLVGSMALVRP